MPATLVIPREGVERDRPRDQASPRELVIPREGVERGTEDTRAKVKATVT